jgi:hypothetical protein
MSKHQVVRTVRGGRVKIGGHWYVPRQHHQAYDGTLDGRRYLFGRYWSPWLPEKYEPFVSLWGPEEAIRVTDEAEFDRLMNESPHVIDGTMPWDCWERTGPKGAA